MCNSVQDYVLDAARTAVEATPELQKWEAEYESLLAKLRESAPQLENDFFNLVVGGMAQHGAAMFKMGWQLRDNPDKLLQLPEPE